MGDIFIQGIQARPMERSLPSTMWMMPTKPFWNSSEILVQTSTRNYTITDYRQMFIDMGYKTGWQIRSDIEASVAGPVAPGVEVFCMHGIHQPTVASLVYSKGKFPDKQPKVINGDGDGTVNARSLVGCLDWVHHQKQPVHHKQFPGLSHLGILKNSQAIHYIMSVLAK